jgi:hypothetical protein
VGARPRVKGYEEPPVFDPPCRISRRLGAISDKPLSTIVRKGYRMGLTLTLIVYTGGGQGKTELLSSRVGSK